MFLVILFIITTVIPFWKYILSDLVLAIGSVNKWCLLIGIVMVLIFLFFEGAIMKKSFHSMNRKSSMRDVLSILPSTTIFVPSPHRQAAVSRFSPTT